MSKKWVFKHRHPQAEQVAAPVTQEAAVGEDPATCSSKGSGATPASKQLSQEFDAQA